MKLILAPSVEEQTTDRHKLAMQMFPILEEALNLAMERHKTYGSSWKKRGYMGSISWMGAKVDRLLGMLWTGTPNPDEKVMKDCALDEINYCVFFELNRRAGNKWGPQ